VIDCDVVVTEQDVAAASKVLIGLGFLPEGDLGIPSQWAFKEPERLARGPLPEAERPASTLTCAAWILTRY
jgi:hypothetical protein